MNLIQQLDKEQVEKLSAGKDIPAFGPGDTVIVNVKVVEGERSRVQAYEGVCIGRSGRGLHENFTVRKISYGEGVERVFPLYSPMIDSIKVVRRGKVRRAKLYYLRGLRGKKARIAEAQGPTGARRPRLPRIDPESSATAKGAACGPFFVPGDAAAALLSGPKRGGLYRPHDFQGSAHRHRRPRPATLAVFRPARRLRASRALTSLAGATG